MVQPRSGVPASPKITTVQRIEASSQRRCQPVRVVIAAPRPIRHHLAGNVQTEQCPQAGLLGHLAGTYSQGHKSDAVEMWRATKDTRELTCIARHLPSGAVYVCVFRGDDFHRTQLCQSAPDARALAADCARSSKASGWMVNPIAIES